MFPTVPEVFIAQSFEEPTPLSTPVPPIAWALDEKSEPVTAPFTFTA